MTSVPRTYFFQNQWVLCGAVDDPRRLPTPEQIGCEPQADLSRPTQPSDMTRYGSRVIDGTSIAAVQGLSRSGSNASIVCDGSEDYAPLWLAPSSAAPAFTPTAIGILGALFIVAAGLTHPAAVELSFETTTGDLPRGQALSATPPSMTEMPVSSGVAARAGERRPRRAARPGR